MQIELASCAYDLADTMKVKAIVHEADEGGFWAEVPAIPGCATHGAVTDAIYAGKSDAAKWTLANVIWLLRAFAARLRALIRPVGHLLPSFGREKAIVSGSGPSPVRHAWEKVARATFGA